MKLLIKNANVVYDNNIIKQSIIIENEFIKKIYNSDNRIFDNDFDKIIDAEGLFLIPGVIDTHVHFREPGLTYKADIYTESRAAAAGGVCSFIDMPNTIPITINNDLIEEKNKIAENSSIINYSFYIGATNENINSLKNIDKQNIAGIKLFLGSSTGNMLVNNINNLKKLFEIAPVIVAVHAEDDNIINNNLSEYKLKYTEDIPASSHSQIRSREACFEATKMIVEIAKQYNKKVHILHLSTKEELKLFTNNQAVENKLITAEVCAHHLWFNDTYYKELKNKIKCNPSIKTENDRLALIEAIKNKTIDTIASDHAPHTIEEKNKKYLYSPSGIPIIQHSLLILLELYKKNYLTLNDIVRCMCNNPAKIFNINKRGFIKENYYADLVLINPNKTTSINKDNILYKCAWSPFENYIFKNSIDYTIINGKIVFENNKIVENNSRLALKLQFNR